MAILTFSLLLVSLYWPGSTLGLTCVGCTSDPSNPNERCIRNTTDPIIPTTSATSSAASSISVPSLAQWTLVECDPEEYENPSCFTMVTAEGKQTSNLPYEKMKWNRGCCDPAPNSATCPTNKPMHDKAEGYWEIWRSWCDSGDACNQDDPYKTGGGNDGGSNSGQGILVVFRGNSTAS